MATPRCDARGALELAVTGAHTREATRRAAGRRPLPIRLSLMPDPHAKLRDQVFTQVLDGPGDTPAALRRAVAQNIDVPPDLQPLVAKIHAHAYKVTDDAFSRLRSSYDDDKLFEVVVSAAL